VKLKKAGPQQFAFRPKGWSISGEGVEGVGMPEKIEIAPLGVFCFWLGVI
jgi:hypothetical protein